MSDAIALTVTAVEDFAAADDFSKKHAPFLTAAVEEDKTRLTVEVGHEVPHPNGSDHFIEWIVLYVGDAEIARASFAAGVAYPNVSVLVELAPGTVVRAVASCNLHGRWAYSITL